MNFVESRRARGVSVILPTYNESENIRAAIDAIRMALAERDDYEILVVDDDSPDLTWKIVDRLGLADPRIRTLLRKDRKGLSSAIVDGLRAARGARRVVMDADLQHPAETIPDLLNALEDAEIVVASRYVDGGDVSGWSTVRAWGSRAFTWWTRFRLDLKVSDPLSGFFGIRAETFHAVEPQLNPRGYKALLEILARAGGVAQAEVPLRFGVRHAGNSKLGLGTAVDLLRSISELREKTSRSVAVEARHSR